MVSADIKGNICGSRFDMSHPAAVPTNHDA